MRNGIWFTSLALAFRCTLGTPLALDTGWDIFAVTYIAESLPSHCWEFGIAAEALLELYSPMVSVF